MAEGLVFLGDAILDFSAAVRLASVTPSVWTLCSDFKAR